jgi:hypothetical protein
VAKKFGLSFAFMTTAVNFLDFRFNNCWNNMPSAHDFPPDEGQTLGLALGYCRHMILSGARINIISFARSLMGSRHKRTELDLTKEPLMATHDSNYLVPVKA